MTTRRRPKLRIVKPGSETLTAPSDQRTAERKPEWFGTDSGPIHRVDLARVDALIANGVITEAQRSDAEWIFSALTTAGGPHGGELDLRMARKLIELAGKGLPKQEAVNRGRVEVVAILRQYKETGVWAPAMSILYLLKRIDERFGALSRAVIDRHAKDRSVLGFAARLTCECGAFGDRRRDAAEAAFERAAREVSRKPRPSRGKP